MNDIDETIKQELGADGSNSGVEEEVFAPYPFDTGKISISNRKISLSNVIRRLGRGLIHAASIQRRENLWDDGRKSRLIESIMLKIPLPLFYAAETKDDQLFIVDGLQRLSAIRGFVLEKEYKLESLEFLKELDGKYFDEIPEQMQIRISETELDFAVIGSDSPPEVQRNIFKRLNTGGLPLTDQEIRNALYFGPVTELLEKLVDTNEFKTAIDNSVKDSRMAAQELVLRSFAFMVFDISEYKKDDEMDSFLSDTMQLINRAIEPKAYSKYNNPLSVNRNATRNFDDSLKKEFLAAMERATQLFENCAFRITTPIKRDWGKQRAPVNKSLFELWTVILAKMTESDFEKLKKNKSLLHKKLDAEFDSNNSMLRNCIGKDSLKISGIKGRYEIVNKIVQQVLMEDNS
ncbi:MAG: DUF262 domain-containing protein [Spirochaetes bacterium]|nr:DUF262 domain-containing protein [Spirochaetota bacterium]